MSRNTYQQVASAPPAYTVAQTNGLQPFGSLPVAQAVQITGVQPVAQAVIPVVHAVPLYDENCYVESWTEEQRRKFEKTAQELEWSPQTIEVAAQALWNTTVVIIVDDSGSMSTQSRESNCPQSQWAIKTRRNTTRWCELVHFIKNIMKMSWLMDSVHIQPLNGNLIENVNKPGIGKELLDALFLKGPTYMTPLIGKMNTVFNAYSPENTGRDLITIIATDGAPSDFQDHGYSDPTHAVKKTLLNRPCFERSFVTFLTCTDEDLEYLQKLDKKLRNVDESDDYASELKQVKKTKRCLHFSYGDYALKVLIGSKVRSLDVMDEKVKRPKLTPWQRCCLCLLRK